MNLREVKKILGIQGDLAMTPDLMKSKIKIAFFNDFRKIETSKNIDKFKRHLIESLGDLDVEVVNFSEHLLSLPLFKKLKRLKVFLYINFKLLKKGQFYSRNFYNFIFGKKLQKGIAVFSFGVSVKDKLPMDYTNSFKRNPVITVIDRPSSLSASSSFKEHMDFAIKSFASTMSNIVVAVGKDDWTIYSFNLSFPTYKYDSLFKKNLLESLITKIAAPVVPPDLNDFKIINDYFDPTDSIYKVFVDDLVKSGPLFESTHLYPEGKKVEELPFQTPFYKWIGSLHLDKRKGMSYGFLARQLPVSVPVAKELNSEQDFKNKFGITVELDSKKLFVQIPRVEVITSKSGSKKTALNPKGDIVLMGIDHGKMILGMPEGVSLSDDVRPSFDTRVILAHCLGNVIAASLFKYKKINVEFINQLESDGMALAHWHGYVNEDELPSGYYVHGKENPSVSCSALQSAIFAIEGKLQAAIESIELKTEFKGDIHVEPHHGINFSASSLVAIAELILNNKNLTSLGNKYS